MQAHCRVTTDLATDGPGLPRTRLATLYSQAPLRLRPTLANEPEPWAHQAGDLARVSMSSAAAGPIGGDQYCIEAHAGPGSTLVVAQIAHTLLLPGRDGAASRTQVRLCVDDDATLIWLPQPCVAVRGCDHINDIDVHLGVRSRFILRDEILLGRHREAPGRVRQRLRVTGPAGSIYRADVDLGHGSTTAAVTTGAHRAVGSILIVDPTLPAGVGTCLDLPGDAVTIPLASGGGVLITGLADDSLALRSQLSAGLTRLGPPWASPNPRRADALTTHEGDTP